MCINYITRMRALINNPLWLTARLSEAIRDVNQIARMATLKSRTALAADARTPLLLPLPPSSLRFDAVVRKRSNNICLRAFTCNLRTKSLAALSSESRRNERESAAFEAQERFGCGKTKLRRTRDEKTNGEQTHGRGEERRSRGAPVLLYISRSSSRRQIDSVGVPPFSTFSGRSPSTRGGVPRGIALIYVDTIFIRTDR